jgi:geranylgeranyl diphosphate synthase type II
VRLEEAIRYSALSPGKRLRPLLVLTACEAVGGDWRRALPAAVALECVHAFSLVHDDLPAMDDDDWRRGRPTTHRKFGEALAILAGDALLAFAFEELTRLASLEVRPRRVLGCILRLADASGSAYLMAGQALDIEAEGRPVTRGEVLRIHLRKTGALLGASMAIGGIVGGGSARQVEDLDRAGMRLGLAFQIQDDLLNLGSSLDKLGKRAGTDAARGKATFPRAVGEARARSEAATFLAGARELVEHCTRPARLLELIDRIAERDR